MKDIFIKSLITAAVYKHTFLTYLYQELNHFSVDKTMDCFSVYMSDEVPSFESCFMCGPAFFHILNTAHDNHNCYYSLFIR